MKATIIWLVIQLFFLCMYFDIGAKWERDKQESHPMVITIDIDWKTQNLSCSYPGDHV